MTMLLLDGPAIAHDLGLSAGTIRNWASAGYIVRVGTDRRGRALYDYDAVEAVRDTPPSARVVVTDRGTMTPDCSTTRMPRE